jgi:hypothetical protein
MLRVEIQSFSCNARACFQAAGRRNVRVKNKTHCVFFYDPNTERAEATKPEYIPLKNKRRTRQKKSLR